MRKLLSAFAAVAVLVTLPTVANAQRRAAASSAPRMHEFGVDLGLAWYSQDGGDADNQTGIEMGTPLDLRVGFPSGSKLMFEGRLGLGFDSKGGFDENGDPTSAYTFTPAVSVLYAMGHSTHRKGMYLTGGLGMNIVDGGEFGGMGFGLGGGVGWRKPFLSGGALRYEVGLRYDGEISDNDLIIQPSTLSIGARVGLSMWH